MRVHGHGHLATAPHMLNTLRARLIAHFDRLAVPTEPLLKALRAHPPCQPLFPLSDNNHSRDPWQGHGRGLRDHGALRAHEGERRRLLHERALAEGVLQVPGGDHERAAQLLRQVFDAEQCCRTRSCVTHQITRTGMRPPRRVSALRPFFGPNPCSMLAPGSHHVSGGGVKRRACACSCAGQMRPVRVCSVCACNACLADFSLGACITCNKHQGRKVPVDGEYFVLARGLADPCSAISLRVATRLQNPTSDAAAEACAAPSSDSQLQHNQKSSRNAQLYIPSR